MTSLETTFQFWVNHLTEGLSIQLPYERAHPPGEQLQVDQPPIPAAVLLLFALSDRQECHLLYTRRAESVDTHKGQIAFPGGHCEPTDWQGVVGTALRETEEEVGIHRDHIHVLGRLPPLITANHFLIDPIVGFLKISLEEVRFQLNPDEIAEVFWVPVETLRQVGVYRREWLRVPRSEAAFPIDVYQVPRSFESRVEPRVEFYRIWGATGTMTKNMLDRLQAFR